MISFGKYHVNALYGNISPQALTNYIGDEWDSQCISKACRTLENKVHTANDISK